MTSNRPRPPAVSEDPASYERWREAFDRLPLLVEGESKAIRRIDDSTVIVRLKPTLFSYTANRAAVVEGTERLRLRISARLWRLLQGAGVPTTILHVGADYYVSRCVHAPPIEVIVKAAHVGTPKHIYKDLDQFPTRTGEFIRPESRHEPYVRFDWRNPLPGRDECMPLWLADRFIDTRVAERTALKAFTTLATFLADRGIDLLDICFFITAEGDTLFSEVSPDCMRAKHRSEDLDKDLWRKGKDAETIRQRWSAFLAIVEKDA